MLFVLVFGECFHLPFVAFCCSSLLVFVSEIESVLSQKLKQANAFGCLFLPFIARFVFCRCFHLNIALLVLVFCWYKRPKRATKGKKVQMESNLKGELQRKMKLISYERVFKILESYMYITGIGQALLKTRVRESPKENLLTLEICGYLRKYEARFRENFQTLEIEIFSKTCEVRASSLKK